MAADHGCGLRICEKIEGVAVFVNGLFEITGFGVIIIGAVIIYFGVRGQRLILSSQVMRNTMAQATISSHQG